MTRMEIRVGVLHGQHVAWIRGDARTVATGWGDTPDKALEEALVALLATVRDRIAREVAA